MYRRRSRIQHIKIVDPKAVSLLERLFWREARRVSALSSDGLSLPLQVEQATGSSHRPSRTPQRRGGAVQSYIKGTAITEIQWRMRLKHLQTLEFYLQEVGAASALASLSETCSRKVRSVGSCYEFL